MSNDGGAGHGPHDTTSYGLQPPRPAEQGGTPHPHPYAEPTQVVPGQQAPAARPTEAEPGAGRLVGGRYRLLSKLGHGGMGTVWRAKDETVDREVAVKEPRVPDHLPERERANAFERMRREARAAARLDHPAVVNVHDVVVEDGQPWIVMEFVRGRSLGAALREGTLGAREAARVGLEVLGALEAAHAAGILHRDVKPDNVMLGDHDRVVLTDFGIAQIEGETNLTDTGGFVGSPEFIAPERVLGQRPGPASDLWSLGVVLYAATEGVSPFRRSNTPATLQSVLNATPAAPASARGPLADAINGLLHKDPGHRPNAARVRALLDEALRPPQPPQLPPTRVVTVAGDQGGARGKGVFLSRKALAVTGAAVAAVVVASVLVAVNPFGGDASDAGDWEKHEEKKLGATVWAPKGYATWMPGDDAAPKEHWVSYRDSSGQISVTLTLDKKAEDDLNYIAGTSMAEAYEDMKDLDQGSSVLGSALSPDELRPGKKTTQGDYQGSQSAENVVPYTNKESETEYPREATIFYYRTKSGDMYKLWIDYPAKSDFTERGREVAKKAIADLEISKP
ncbi:serine/threonine-protein kinase [Streptomyces spectabilis]|uniref:non-specific serine/threonine protein kinase n=1 Tax=Streptomyces spectabilis TaxID=68270 RepID=A0A5P2XGU1_STRST|nr:serine/threonine-protein kinase [Streptomyces spectabilis]MBB5108776.1 putative Ser/Thr protein kinase [Streptomyces spectabilis]MCI3904576.1 serine/threonine protein kinase [Streptomyces spectabilis]QEV61662.1 serine/threonine protein kinase [Streptomyces spectabilis]GGV28094.1 protein kinase [Streptomyces spectabilis]